MRVCSGIVGFNFRSLVAHKSCIFYEFVLGEDSSLLYINANDSSFSLVFSPRTVGGKSHCMMLLRPSSGPHRNHIPASAAIVNGTMDNNNKKNLTIEYEGHFLAPDVLSATDSSGSGKSNEEYCKKERPTKNRIAFGSCNNQELKNNFWPIIEARDPAAFIWGGDAIYADYHKPRDWSTFPPKEGELVCATPARLRELYRRQRSEPSYRRIIESNVTIFGTFDDHDYGCNNADRTYEYSHESGVAFVDFLGLPMSSAMARRAHAGYGVYGVQLFDFGRPYGQYAVDEREAGIDPDSLIGLQAPLGTTLSNQTVAIFVLDVRTNKTPWKTGSAAYLPDYEGDFLGENQWNWFESAIRRSPASVNVVASGLQVHANKFPDGNIAEAWSKYPRAQERLFDSLLQDGVSAPVLISGDVHMTQMMRKDCVRRGEYESSPRPIVEMTTSGMTHSWGSIPSPPLTNSAKRPTLKKRYQTFASSTLLRLLHTFCPWYDLLEADKSAVANGEASKSGLQFSLQKNFGELEFDWEERVITFRTFGEDPNTPPLLMNKYSMDQLSGRAVVPNKYLGSNDFLAEAQARSYLPRSEWICINHRGRDNQLLQMFGHVATGAGLLLLVPMPLLLPCLISLLLMRHASRRSARLCQPSYERGATMKQDLCLASKCSK